jgi:hypothetical protein
MDKGRDKQPKGAGETGSARSPGGPKASDRTKPPEAGGPGSVVADNRGRNAWQFHGETIDSTSMMLQRLDNPALALEPTRKTKRLDPDAAQDSGRPSTGKGPAGKTPAGKVQTSPGSAARGSSGTARGSSGTGRRDDDSEQSFEQRFSVKPGKNSGGGFDPYNRS